MTKLIGYARVSTKAQDTDRQVQDLLAAGVRRDDLYPTTDSPAHWPPGLGWPTRSTLATLW